jgi:LPPG:FO 2-phospho-L-lactate transferase (EC 2.7.1.-)
VIALLSGGVGGSRFAAGLYDLVGDELTAIVNTADDEVIYGLHVSPDVDTVLYTLSGIGDWERGWGVAGDTFRCNEALGRLGRDNWFRIGDADLGNEPAPDRAPQFGLEALGGDGAAGEETRDKVQGDPDDRQQGQDDRRHVARAHDVSGVLRQAQSRA